MIIKITWPAWSWPGSDQDLTWTWPRPGLGGYDWKLLIFSLEKFCGRWRWVGTFDYSVSPGPYFWLWNFNFEFVLDWNIDLDLDLDLTWTWPGPGPGAWQLSRNLTLNKCLSYTISFLPHNLFCHHKQNMLRCIHQIHHCCCCISNNLGLSNWYPFWKVIKMFSAAIFIIINDTFNDITLKWKGFSKFEWISYRSSICNVLLK